MKWFPEIKTADQWGKGLVNRKTADNETKSKQLRCIFDFRFHTRCIKILFKNLKVAISSKYILTPFFYFFKIRFYFFYGLRIIIRIELGQAGSLIGDGHGNPHKLKLPTKNTLKATGRDTLVQ